MLYFGVLGELLGIAEEEVERALDAQLGHKPNALALNHRRSAQAGSSPGEAAEARPVPARRMDRTLGKILIDGNTAAALGAMFAGVTVGPVPDHAVVSLVEALVGYLDALSAATRRREGDLRGRPGGGRDRRIGMVLGAAGPGRAR